MNWEKYFFNLKNLGDEWGDLEVWVKLSSLRLFFIILKF